MILHPLSIKAYGEFIPVLGFRWVSTISDTVRVFPSLGGEIREDLPGVRRTALLPGGYANASEEMVRPEGRPQIKSWRSPKSPCVAGDANRCAHRAPADGYPSNHGLGCGLDGVPCDGRKMTAPVSGRLCPAGMP